MKKIKITVSWVLALSLTLTSLAFTACANDGVSDTGDSQASEEVLEGEGGSEKSESTTSDSLDDKEQYSKLLQNVLNDEYYNSLIAQAKQDTAFAKSAYFAEHPYAFLEAQGIDTTAIKQGELDCTTYSYEKKDEPYRLALYTYAENANGYYDEFIIEYELTEQEMADYRMLHLSLDENSQDANVYYQIGFINDQISKEKTPVSVNHTKMSIEAHKALKNNSKLIGNVKGLIDYQTTGFDVLLKQCEPEKNKITLVILPTKVSTNNYTQIVIGELPFHGAGQRITEEAGVFVGPYRYGGNLYLNDIQGVNLNKENVRKIHFPFVRSFADMNDIKSGALTFD